jgi:3-dehydroquinate synthase
MISPDLIAHHSQGKTQIFFMNLDTTRFGEETYFLVDSAVCTIADFPSDRTAFIDVSEENKNLEEVSRLSDSLNALGMNRHSSLVVVGGGVTQDLGTILSYLYMRGIRWSFVPTTTNSMLDSCIGGKSAINTLKRKNLLGNFYPPVEIFIDTRIVATLSHSDYYGGILEGVKIIYATKREKIKNFIETLRAFDFAVSDEIVRESLSAKIEVIERDEFDKGPRLLLNYGHTFGHALESASAYKIPHGIAIGIGMIAANSFAGHEVDDLRELNRFIIELLLRAGIQNHIRSVDIDWSIFEKAIASDKKHTRDQYCLILPNSEGELHLSFIEKSTHCLTSLTEVTRQTMESLSG